MAVASIYGPDSLCPHLYIWYQVFIATSTIARESNLFDSCESFHTRFYYLHISSEMNLSRMSVWSVKCLRRRRITILRALREDEEAREREREREKSAKKRTIGGVQGEKEREREREKRNRGKRSTQRHAEQPARLNKEPTVVAMLPDWLTIDLRIRSAQQPGVMRLRNGNVARLPADRGAPLSTRPSSTAAVSSLSFHTRIALPCCTHATRNAIRCTAYPTVRPLLPRFVKRRLLSSSL